MENKKTKLTLSGIAKKSIENIELAKTQSKNSVVIEKKQTDFQIKILLVGLLDLKLRNQVQVSKVQVLRQGHQLHLNQLRQ